MVFYCHLENISITNAEKIPFRHVNELKHAYENGVRSIIHSADFEGWTKRAASAIQGSYLCAAYSAGHRL